MWKRFLCCLGYYVALHVIARMFDISNTDLHILYACIVVSWIYIGGISVEKEGGR